MLSKHCRGGTIMSSVFIFQIKFDPCCLLMAISRSLCVRLFKGQQLQTHAKRSNLISMLPGTTQNAKYTNYLVMMIICIYERHVIYPHSSSFGFLGITGRQIYRRSTLSPHSNKLSLALGRLFLASNHDDCDGGL